jgi:creatinine amidohydrolase/Fe(II)-dependent formamide hydrolase-like protein
MRSNEDGEADPNVVRPTHQLRDAHRVDLVARIESLGHALSHTGVHGDATKATAEKGRILLDAAVEECVGFVRELREKPLPVRWEPRETPA